MHHKWIGHAVLLAAFVGPLQAETPYDRRVIIISPPSPKPVPVKQEARCRVQARYRVGNTEMEAPASELTDWNWYTVSPGVHHYHNSSTLRELSHDFTATADDGMPQQATVKGRPTLSGFLEFYVACAGRDSNGSWQSFSAARPEFEAIGAKVGNVIAKDGAHPERTASSGGTLKLVYKSATVRSENGSIRVIDETDAASQTRAAALQAVKDGTLPWGGSEPDWEGQCLSSNYDGQETASWQHRGEVSDNVSAKASGISKSVTVAMVPNSPWAIQGTLKESVRSGPVSLMESALQRLEIPVTVTATGEIKGAGEWVDKYASPDVDRKLTVAGSLGFTFSVENLRATVPIAAVPGLSAGIQGTAKLELKIAQCQVCRDPSQAPASQFTSSGGDLDGKITLGVGAVVQWGGSLLYATGTMGVEGIATATGRLVQENSGVSLQGSTTSGPVVVKFTGTVTFAGNEVVRYENRLFTLKQPTTDPFNFPVL